MYTTKQKEEACNFLMWLYPETNILVDHVEMEDEEIKEIRSSFLFKLWRKDEAIRELKEEIKKAFEPVAIFVKKIINVIIKKS